MITHEYAAGFLDGEGSFMTKNGVRRASCGNTYLPVLMELKAKYGGAIYDVHRYKPQGTKPQWLWVITAAYELIPMLEALIPHLLEKRTRAEELLAACRLVGHQTRKRRSDAGRARYRVVS